MWPYGRRTPANRPRRDTPTNPPDPKETILPDISIITASSSLGAPGPDLTESLAPHLNARVISLTDIEETLGPGDPKGAAFTENARNYYRARNLSGDQPLSIDPYPVGSDGTEILVIERTRSLGSPGPALMDIIEGELTSDTLTLDELRSAHRAVIEDGNDTEQARTFVAEFESAYEGAGLDADDPVTLCVW